MASKIVVVVLVALLGVPQLAVSGPTDPLYDPVPYAHHAQVCDAGSLLHRLAHEYLTRLTNREDSKRLLEASCKEYELQALVIARADGFVTLRLRLRMPPVIVGATGMDAVVARTDGAEVRVDWAGEAEASGGGVARDTVGRTIRVTDYPWDASRIQLAAHRVDLLAFLDGEYQGTASYRQVPLVVDEDGSLLLRISRIAVPAADSYRVAVHLTADDEVSGNAVHAEPLTFREEVGSSLGTRSADEPLDVIVHRQVAGHWICLPVSQSVEEPIAGPRRPVEREDCRIRPGGNAPSASVPDRGMVASSSDRGRRTGPTPRSRTGLVDWRPTSSSLGTSKPPETAGLRPLPSRSAT